MSDLFAKVEAMRQSAAQRAEENRRRMPTIARWVDETKAAFPGATVAFACEGGVTLGAPLLGGIKLSETLVGTFNRVASKGKK